MITLIALRNFALRPWRSLFLLLGYSLGVAVMIVLLSIGEALLTQAQQERLVGGGQITVLPEGIDIEVLKTGGLGGMFFSIDHARFIYRQLLAAPRFSPWISAAAPQIESKLLYLRKTSGREYAVESSGEIPSLTRAVGAAPDLAGGSWTDDSLDRRWRDPTPAELRDDIDHFHLPPPSARGDSTWGEWHYFNVLSSDHRRWAFISLIVGGRVPGGTWGGQVLVTLHEQGGASRRFVANVPAAHVQFSTTRADLTMGESSVHVLPDGRYAVHARAGDGRGGFVNVNLTVSPTPGAYFPGAALSGSEVVSGYVVPALRADADGSICVGTATNAAACEELHGVQAYHDHNWGVWRGVSWEWGAARAGPYALLYGRVEPPDSVAASQPLFVYLVDSLGFLRLFRPKEITYSDSARLVGGDTVRVPRTAELYDARGDDTLRISLAIEDAAVTDTRAPLVQRGDYRDAKRIARPYFIQMKGRATLKGRIGGREVNAEGYGFFETYR